MDIWSYNHVMKNELRNDIVTLKIISVTMEKSKKMN